MSTKQQWIVKYLKTQFAGGISIEYIGDDAVKIKDINKDEMTFTTNKFGDIIDASTNELIAESDLKHDDAWLEETPEAEPSEWKNSYTYFSKLQKE